MVIVVDVRAATESGKVEMNPSGYKRFLGFKLRVVLFGAR